MPAWGSGARPDSVCSLDELSIAPTAGCARLRRCTCVRWCVSARRGCGCGVLPPAPTCKLFPFRELCAEPALAPPSGLLPSLCRSPPSPFYGWRRRCATLAPPRWLPSRRHNLLQSVIAVASCSCCLRARPGHWCLMPRLAVQTAARACGDVPSAAACVPHVSYLPISILDAPCSNRVTLTRACASWWACVRVVSRRS